MLPRLLLGLALCSIVCLLGGSAGSPPGQARVELGRHLFYDRRLSANGTLACASCHQQARAFSDGRATPAGASGAPLRRNSPGLANLADAGAFGWADPTLTALEQQIRRPLFGSDPPELGVRGHEAAVLARLRGDARYRRLFAAAFPARRDPFSWEHSVAALAAFCRALESRDSPYDRYLAGDTAALAPAARRGMRLFFSDDLGCRHCHAGLDPAAPPAAPIFQNIGLYNLDGRGAYPPGDRGLAEVTGRPEDVGRFRAPSLRNVALTGPYMHDGSVASLEQVIRIYEAGGRDIPSGPYAGDGRRSPLKSGLVAGFLLTDRERADLRAFLESLSDQGFVSDPRWADPFAPGARPRP